MMDWLKDCYESIVKLVFILIICACTIGGLIIGQSFGSPILALIIGCFIGFFVAVFVCGFAATIISIANDLKELRRSVSHVCEKLDNPDE